MSWNLPFRRRLGYLSLYAFPLGALLPGLSPLQGEVVFLGPGKTTYILKQFLKIFLVPWKFLEEQDTLT